MLYCTLLGTIDLCKKSFLPLSCWVTTPSKNKRSGPSRQNKGNKIDPGKAHFVASQTSSGSAVRVRPIDDLTRRPMAPDLNFMHLPKNIKTQIHWFTVDCSLVFGLSVSSISEGNRSFALSDLSIGSAISTLFDQYAIFCVYARTNVTVSAATATSVPRYYTAIDYDNVTTLGSVAAIQAYGTVSHSSTVEVQERYIEPCAAPALYSGSAFNHFSQSRVWIDSVNTTTPHYGFRLIVDNLGAAAVGSVNVEFTYVICARNSI
jgi:hypothetical protein